MATIIKRDAKHEPPSNGDVRRVAFDFEDFSGQAEQYLGHVRSEAAKIVQEAHAEAERIRQQAEQAGRKAAEQAVERVLDEKVASQMRSLLPALNGVATELSDARAAWQDYWERTAVELATKIAERVVRGELTRRPEITNSWVRESLEMATGSSAITIRLNPDDMSHLRDEVQKITATLTGLAPAEVVSDERVTAGGCIVDTKFGRIDQRVETQIARLFEELT